MKLFTTNLVKRELYGKSLNECKKILIQLGINKDTFDVYRNSKGHPLEMYFKLNGLPFKGYLRKLVFNKNSGLCVGEYKGQF